MRRNKPKDKRITYSLFSFSRFFLYLFLTGFVVTCSFLLFFSDKFSSESIFIPENTLNERAISSAANILFICIVLSVVDTVKRRITYQTPVKKILDTAHRITHGDFNARITLNKNKKLKNELDVIIEDFNKMAESISQTETLKTDFIANVSHEIKTPLAVILNYATLLQNDALPKDKIKEYTKGIMSASKNLNELITGILRLNKLENQQIFPQKEKFNLSEQLCESMLKFESQWEEKQLDIITDFDEKICVTSDRELLEIIWSNLLSNAIKFTPYGGKISVSIKQDNNRVRISVADNGIGMDEQTLSHIFEKFYQGDLSHSTKGNGLGLALVKRVADITGAEFYVESEADKGSVFTVILPLEV